MREREETDPIKGIRGSLLAWPTRGAHRSLHNPLQTEKKTLSNCRQEVGT